MAWGESSKTASRKSGIGGIRLDQTIRLIIFNRSPCAAADAAALRTRILDIPQNAAPVIGSKNAEFCGQYTYLLRL